MKGELYTDLAWLLRAPEDFTARVKALAETTESLGNAMQRPSLRHIKLISLIVQFELSADAHWDAFQWHIFQERIHVRAATKR